MKTLTENAKKTLKYIALARANRYTGYDDDMITIGSIIKYPTTGTYIVVNMSIDQKQKQVMYSLKEVPLFEHAIDIKEHLMYTFAPHNAELLAIDGLKYLTSLANENPKKEALSKQIKEMEDKLSEMKKEVSTL